MTRFVAKDLVVIVPSRGRPEQARALADAFAETCTTDVDLIFAIDDDDPTRDSYELFLGTRAGHCISSTRTMVESLNYAANAYLGAGEPFAVGFMGDDHRPRTRGWDEQYLAALRAMGTGIVYGNDLLQGQNLPTQCAMTSDIVRALGYMAPPELRHMYVDNFWLTLGREAGCIRYLPDVVVEHMHPVAGKAEWTEGHKRVNTNAIYNHDYAVYYRWATEGQSDADVAKVRALREAAA